MSREEQMNPTLGALDTRMKLGALDTKMKLGLVLDNKMKPISASVHALMAGLTRRAGRTERQQKCCQNWPSVGGRTLSGSLRVSGVNLSTRDPGRLPRGSNLARLSRI